MVSMDKKAAASRFIDRQTATPVSNNIIAAYTYYNLLHLAVPFFTVRPTRKSMLCLPG